MTVHYHGTPITPRSALDSLAGRRFTVSYTRPDDIERVHEIGKGVMLDNGAFSAWTKGRATDWTGFYRWCEDWLRHPMNWAVIPDVIDGDEAANDDLVEQWPHGERGAPVWHMHESVGRLIDLCRKWPRVCIGSSGDYRVVGTARWHGRMTFALNKLCDEGKPPPAQLHMLRGMAQAGSQYPFHSVDSSDIARNHHRPHNSAAKMAARWATRCCPACWFYRPVQGELFDALSI